MAPMSPPPPKNAPVEVARLWSAVTKLLAQELRIEFGKRKCCDPSWAVLLALVFYLAASVAIAVLCHARLAAVVIP